MNVKKLHKGELLILEFVPSSNELPEEGQRIKLDRTTMELRLQEGQSSSMIHNDHIALIALLSVQPFVRERLYIDWDVSEQFASAVKSVMHYKTEFKSCQGQPYVVREGRPCLAFSGGIDSTAALLLLPENTVCVWLDRPTLGKKTMYNKSAAQHTMSFTKKKGYDVHEISCDVEHVRSPVGFPVDLSSGIAAIAVSSLCNGNSIAYGMVMESAYRTGHSKYRNYPISKHFRTWSQCFEAAGIPLFLPVAGVSEVGTSAIVLASEFDGNARSCIRGEWPNSCENCWKCFRKKLVDFRILSKSMNEEELIQWMRVREVKYKLNSWPVAHENVLAWSLKNPLLKGRIRDSLLNRLEGSTRSLEALTKWYPPSLDLVPGPLKKDFLQRVNQILSPMNEEEIRVTESLDLKDWLESNEGITARENFNQMMTDILI